MASFSSISSLSSLDDDMLSSSPSPPCFSSPVSTTHPSVIAQSGQLQDNPPTADSYAVNLSAEASPADEISPGTEAEDDALSDSSSSLSSPPDSIILDQIENELNHDRQMTGQDSDHDEETEFDSDRDEGSEEENDSQDFISDITRYYNKKIRELQTGKILTPSKGNPLLSITGEFIEPPLAPDLLSKSPTVAERIYFKQLAKLGLPYPGRAGTQERMESFGSIQSTLTNSRLRPRTHGDKRGRQDDDDEDLYDPEWEDTIWAERAREANPWGGGYQQPSTTNDKKRLKQAKRSAVRFA